jgi:transcriptional antiterminator NusG
MTDNTLDLNTEPTAGSVQSDLSQAASQEARWYVVHTYSGYENKVKATLERIVENRGIHDFIQEVSVPEEEIMEIKDGKKKTVRRKIYPGYVLVKMVLTDEIWYIVRNTRGVTGFVGPNSRPIPLTEEELALMGLESSWEPIVDYGVGDSVKVINGPLESFIGTVEEINLEKKKVRVLISMFGRETPVELELAQIMRI